MNVHCTAGRPKIDAELESTNKLKSIAYYLPSSVFYTVDLQIIFGTVDLQIIFGWVEGVISIDRRKITQNNKICYHSQEMTQNNIICVIITL
jgi:hypothetical protein